MTFIYIATLIAMLMLALLNHTGKLKPTKGNITVLLLLVAYDVFAALLRHLN